MTARSGAYRLLARLWMEEIDEEFWQGLSAAALLGVPEHLQLDSAYRTMERYVQGAPGNVLKLLAADYAVLCRGVDPNRGADPYESVHRSSLGLMMQDEWEAVLHFYRSVGYSRTASSVEPEDHLGIELECMAHLCQRAADASLQGDAAAALDAVEQQDTLLNEHLLKWVLDFVQAVLGAADTEFYRAAATITQEYLLMDREFLQRLREEMLVIPGTLASTVA